MHDAADFILKALSDEIAGAIARERTSKAAVAARAGFSVATMSRLMSGTADIPMSRFFEIADALGVNPRKLMDDAYARAERMANDANGAKSK